MAIRNFVFDVGNVLVPWDPAGIERRAFGEERVAAADYVAPLRGHDTWIAVNRGELTLEEAAQRYIAEDGFARGDIDRLYAELFASFPLIADSAQLLRECRAAGYRTFAITDNVHEIVAHLKGVHDFWPLFEVAAVSAELGVLKPDPAIYRWLLDTAELTARECVFLDDVARNVEGARAVGMEAFLFTNAAQARRDLAAIGVDLTPAS
ncbi:HAD family hydrolase [Erythrobacter sp.]|uniref:HAD family hydrolase n=1 Tax=Erythrobacter sp. TaxID=1042 RepID=UPI002EA7E672|nr:HAD family phosphatase [Erythrobacter sp.]